MQGMDDPNALELTALRRRAYGPDADIDADPAALARLRELEEQDRARAAASEARAEGAAEAVAQPDEPAESAPALTAVAAAGDATGDPAADTAADMTGDARDGEPRPPRPIATRWILAWAASVAAVAIVVGGLVFGLAAMPPVPTASGARQVETLTQPVEAGEWLKRWAGGESVRVFSFEGLTVARTPWSMFGQGDDDCLFVVADQRIGDDGSINGPIYTGCRAGSFPATAEFLVGIDSPQQLRDRFGDGTALQFVLDGDVVGVFVGAPVPSPTPTPTTA